MADTKMLKMIGKSCPIAYSKFFGRKYVLPKYREGEYPDLDFENLISFDRCLQFGLLQHRVDDVMRCAVANNFAALHFNRPTLFLERELGEALLRTEMLADLSTGDIRWRWPALKIVLPKGLISIERPDGPRSLTHFDVCQIDPKAGIRIPFEIGKEFDKFLAKIEPNSNHPTFNRVEFLYKEHGICISAAIDIPETTAVTQTLYGMMKPWGSIRLDDYRAVQGDLSTPFPQDATDRALITRLEHIVLNTLLFLSAAPLEYEAETVLRTARREGSRVVPGLIAARFVGQVQLRPIPKGTGAPGTPTGRHMVQHWRSGHWKRQVHGVGGAQRKLIWIQPYQTQTQPEEKHDEQLPS